MRAHSAATRFMRQIDPKAGERITRATLVLGIGGRDELLSPDIRALEVHLNGDLVHVFDRSDLQGPPLDVRLTFPPGKAVRTYSGGVNRLPHNLEFRWRTVEDRACPARVECGTWAFVRSAELELATVSRKDSNSVAEIHTLFLDPWESTADLHLLLPRGADARTLEAAASLVVYFARASEAELTLHVSEADMATLGAEEIDVRAPFVAFDPGCSVGGDEEADCATSTVQVRPSPFSHHAPGSRMLLLQGRDGAQLSTAARDLARNRTVAVDEGEDAAVPGDPWCRDVRYPCIDQSETPLLALSPYSLDHDGHEGASHALPFGISQTLRDRGIDRLVVDAELERVCPDGFEPCPIDVEFNGRYITTLLEPSEISIPRPALRETNELRFHYRPEDDEPLCHDHSEQTLRTRFLDGSTLTIHPPQAVQPRTDIRAFLDGGEPFTLGEGLAQMAVVLPDDPSMVEIRLALETVEALARTHAAHADEASLVFESEVLGALDGDPGAAELPPYLLVIAAVDRSELLPRLTTGLDLHADSGSWRVRHRRSNDAHAEGTITTVPEGPWTGSVYLTLPSPLDREGQLVILSPSPLGPTTLSDDPWADFAPGVDYANVLLPDGEQNHLLDIDPQPMSHAEYGARRALRLAWSWRVLWILGVLLGVAHGAAVLTGRRLRREEPARDPQR
jgi:hypothetical protein